MSLIPIKKRIALELSRIVRHNNARMHPLRTLFWECTLRCNMHCRHCGSDCKVAPQVPDMPADVFLRVIDQIDNHVDHHNTFIIFTGGEALLRDDLETIGAELNRREYPWGLVSNGYLLTPERLQSLIAAGMHTITISLDGFESEHNWMRQHPQSFAHAERAVALLAQTPKVVWDVVTCVNARNIATLESFANHLIELGVKRWRLFTIVPMGRAADDKELQLSPQQIRSLLDFIQRTRKEGRIAVSFSCEGFLGPYEHEVRDYFFYCRAGIEVASILCDGAISGCTSIRSNLHQGNIYHDNLWDVWQHRFQPYRDRSWTRKGPCANCKAYRYCEGNGLHLYDDQSNLRLCHYHDAICPSK